MNNNTIIGLVLAVVIIGGGAFFFTGGEKNTNPINNESANETTTGDISGTVPTEDPQGNPTEPDSNVGIADGPVKEFTISGSNFSYSLKEIKVKEGDTVKITFKNEDGFHDWTLDEFNVRTQKIAAGKTETVTFLANKKGTFEYYCSVGSHRANGMKGNLIVE